MQPRFLASCSDDGVIKVWDVAMPSEPILSAATGSKTVTDLAFHPQRRGAPPPSPPGTVLKSSSISQPVGLLLASLRAEQRVEVYDVSCPPVPASEPATITAWRSYDVAEEVQPPPSPGCIAPSICPPPHSARAACIAPAPPLIPLQAAAACWQQMPDAEPPSVLLSMMSGSFHSIRVRTEQVSRRRARCLEWMTRIVSNRMMIHVVAANSCELRWYHRHRTRRRAVHAQRQQQGAIGRTLAFYSNKQRIQKK
jgi:hypothetical protein